MLRPCRMCQTVLTSLISNVRRTPAYLRHAPPGLYMTCDFKTDKRHATLLVDASVEGEPPLTNGAYLLSSTTGDDLSFQQAQSVLVGLPFAQNASQASRFVDSVLRAALARNGMRISFDNIHTLVIPELHPSVAHGVKELLARLPQLKVACSPLTAAFLSDSSFFSGTRKAFCENDVSFQAQSVVFADVPQKNILLLEDGSSVAVLDESRQLKVATGDLSAARERWRRERRNKLKHFESYALFLYDSVFYAMFVAPSAGVHFGWMPFVVHEADDTALLPLPDYFCLQGTSASSLLEVWRPSELLQRAVTALEKFPEAQRVLATRFGEFSGGADGYLERLEKTTRALEELRSRLGRRLATDTARDMGKWSSIMEDKILKEIIFINKAEKIPENVLAEFRQWASVSHLGRLSRALVVAGATLSPDALPEADQQTATAAAQSSSISSLEGASGVKLLRRHFDKRGMSSLVPIIEREEIDVHVFLAMSPDDFKKVFKATFGVVKKMELLQQELRSLHKNEMEKEG